jgi:hypothetical protein
MASDLEQVSRHGVDVTGKLGEQKRFIINSLVLLSSVALSFAAAEFFLRYTDLQYLFSDEIRFPPNYFISDPELGADQARNQPPGLFVFPGPAHYIFTNSLVASMSNESLIKIMFSQSATATHGGLHPYRKHGPAACGVFAGRHYCQSNTFV